MVIMAHNKTKAKKENLFIIFHHYFIYRKYTTIISI